MKVKIPLSSGDVFGRISEENIAVVEKIGSVYHFNTGNSFLACYASEELGDFLSKMMFISPGVWVNPKANFVLINDRIVTNNIKLSEEQLQELSKDKEQIVDIYGDTNFFNKSSVLYEYETKSGDIRVVVRNIDSLVSIYYNLEKK